MSKVDKALLVADKAICDNISEFEFSDRGFLSQNILGHVRTFVENVALKIYANGRDIDPNNYDIRVDALKYIRQHGELRFLYKFHDMLQKSTSHYIVDKDGSERLMLKYYEHLLKIKIYLKENFNFDVLENIQDFPLNTDTELGDYYKKIAEKIEAPSSSGYPFGYNDRYYVQKVKPFFVDQKIYYEVTFSTASANVSKFDRYIAFTRQEILDNYAIKFAIHNDTICVLGREMSILVIDNFEVSIRPCEWDNLSKILGQSVLTNASSKEYRELMRFLTIEKMPLTELVTSCQEYYDYVKKEVTSQSKSVKIFNILDKCRQMILNQESGENILRYLLYNMNNRIIKLQYSNDPCGRLSDLCLKFQCIPFEEMPYCTSLVRHNPRIYDLYESIPENGHEQELFARYIKNNTEMDEVLFTLKDDIKGFDDIDGLIRKYNNSLYYKHMHRRLEEFHGNIYIKGYVDDSTEIIKILQRLSSTGVAQYTESVDSWLFREPSVIDDENKKEVLRQMFAFSHVALVYGSAGTGKSTLIKHIANFWAEKDKIFLANTHPAVDNMRRKVTAGHSEYNTIAKFLTYENDQIKCDILFIDECSTVSNKDMRAVLEKANFKLLVLVGDVYQIESIYFGNWFGIAQKFIPREAVFELTRPYRTSNTELLTVWNRVRKLEDSILEPLVKYGYVSRFDESIFQHTKEDEIILCLNYDGLYGINNINRFLQNSNPNKSVFWGMNTYKIGDPVLFNESNIFSPLIHNNTKGKIVGIKSEERKIRFDIELENSINEIDACAYKFELIGVSGAGNSVISFCVNKHPSTDEDDAYNDSSVVPFQVAYAVSIHKAQGLEYDSVKIVITNEIEEQITHNIFYTAITRAKKMLKIYWSPETEEAILGRLKIKSSNKDAYLLSQLSSLNINK